MREMLNDKFRAPEVNVRRIAREEILPDTIISFEEYS